MLLNELNAAQIAAVAKAIDDKTMKAARAAFDTEGEHFDVDFTVRISGSVDGGAECETTQINTVQPLKLLMIALNKLNGVTLKSVIDQAMSIDDDAPEFVAIKKNVAAEWAKVAGTTRQMRSGPIKFKGDVTCL
jgi:hypothetical protein